MGKKSTPEYYCSCTPVNFYYVNVFLYDVLIDITLFSEMFFYLIRDYFKPKNWNPETCKDLAYVCTLQTVKDFFSEMGRQTYHNYEQSWQKFGTFLENKLL